MRDNELIAEAKALEAELLAATDATKGRVRRGVVATRLMNRAAKVIQQLRKRLETYGTGGT